MNMYEGFLTQYGNLITGIGEVGTDFAEVALDQLLENEILKDIPVLSTIIRSGKLVMDIHNITVTKHILVFAQSLNKGTLQHEKVKKHFDELEENSKKKMHEMEVIVQAASSHVRYIQDKIMANFYTMYCNPDKEFDWEDFRLFSDITSDIRPTDIEELRKIYVNKQYTQNNYDKYGVNRLSGLGLVDFYNGMSVSEENGPNSKFFYAKINPFGEFYYENGLGDIELYSDLGGEKFIL